MQTNPCPISFGLAVLHDLADEDLDWILDFGTRGEVAPGEMVVSEGTRPDALFLIARGLLSVFVGSDSEGRVSVLGPGQIVGEISFLEDRPAPSSVMALEYSIVISLPFPMLTARLAVNPGFAARLYRAMAKLTSQRLRDLLGAFGRWMQDSPPAALTASENSQELAVATQQVKEKLIAAEQAPAPLSAVDGLAAALGDFASLMDRAVGPDSPETLDLRDELGARVQQELLPFFMKSEVAARLYSKPRGYALDFQTMELLAESGSMENLSALDIVLRNLPSLVGLRNRERLLADMIAHLARGRADRTFRFTTIADRAGRATFSALSRAVDPEQFQVTVFDFDTKALDLVAQRSAVTGRAAQFVCLDTNLLALAAGRFVSAPHNQHLVCSAGLADTLDDRFLLRVINSAYDLLAPGGRLILGFHAASQPDRSLLHYVLNIALIHRSEGEVNELFTRSHFRRPAARVRFENEHSCFLAECVKPGPPLAGTW